MSLPPNGEPDLDRLLAEIPQPPKSVWDEAISRAFLADPVDTDELIPAWATSESTPAANESVSPDTYSPDADGMQEPHSSLHYEDAVVEEPPQEFE